jgi:hypothetical protein
MQKGFIVLCRRRSSPNEFSIYAVMADTPDQARNAVVRIAPDCEVEIDDHPLSDKTVHSLNLAPHEVRQISGPQP